MRMYKFIESVIKNFYTQVWKVAHSDPTIIYDVYIVCSVISITASACRMYVLSKYYVGSSRYLTLMKDLE